VKQLLLGRLDREECHYYIARKAPKRESMWISQ
jgi:hypothetical protein